MILLLLKNNDASCVGGGHGVLAGALAERLLLKETSRTTRDMRTFGIVVFNGSGIAHESHSFFIMCTSRNTVTIINNQAKTEKNLTTQRTLTIDRQRSPCQIWLKFTLLNDFG
jgi:hypothetical protein